MARKTGKRPISDKSDLPDPCSQEIGAIAKHRARKKTSATEVQARNKLHTRLLRAYITAHTIVVCAQQVHKENRHTSAQEHVTGRSQGCAKANCCMQSSNMQCTHKSVEKLKTKRNVRRRNQLKCSQMEILLRRDRMFWITSGPGQSGIDNIQRVGKWPSWSWWWWCSSNFLSGSMLDG